MHGKYYGGGMISAPEQDRSSGKLSVMPFHGVGRPRTLCVFPSIFKGEHVLHKNMVAVHTGHEITVEFDRSIPLQIDGETILDVTKYAARSAMHNMIVDYLKCVIFGVIMGWLNTGMDPTALTHFRRMLDLKNGDLAQLISRCMSSKLL